MKQMTIRAIDPALERGIERLARRKKWSVNQTGLYLMRRGLGFTDEVEPARIGPALDSFAGRWSAGEAKAFDRQVETAFGGVDPEDWK